MASELRVRTSVLIQRPVIEVFEQVCNAPRAVEWVPFCRAATIVTPASGKNSMNGIGQGMKARFRFAMGLLPPVEVEQEVTYFKWGRKLAFTTTRPEDSLTPSPSGLASLLQTSVPTVRGFFDFEATRTGTLLTVELSVWTTGLVLLESIRPLVADSLIQALSRLKENIEAIDLPRVAPKIFFSYRRKKHDFANGRIYSALRSEFGHHAIFRDIESIDGGGRFPELIQRTLHGCDVFLAAIGPTWLADLQRVRPPGKPDWVRLELIVALERAAKGAALIPLVVGSGTAMPRHDELPTDIAALSEFQALRIRPDPDFHADIEAVKERIWAALPDTALQPSPEEPPQTRGSARAPTARAPLKDDG